MLPYFIKNPPSRELWMPELVLYGIRLLAQASLGKLSTNKSAVMTGDNEVLSGGRAGRGDKQTTKTTI